jgi:hypothetical protein
VRLERDHGNNANFSMQQCALRHFTEYLSMAGAVSHAGISDTCPLCLWTPRCDSMHVCEAPIQCFGKCCKLIRADSGPVCTYCVLKYPILFGADSTQRSRHVEYVHDHALFGRAYDASKHDALIRREILKALRWHSVNLRYSAEEPR